MAEGMMKAAITNLGHKYIPEKTAPNIYTPQEEYRNLFPLLDVWGNDRDNSTIQEQVKYIFEKLSVGKKDVKEQLLSIINTLGVIPVDDTRVNRIWKYINLMNKATQMKKYYDTLMTEAEQLKQKKERKVGNAYTDFKRLYSSWKRQSK